MTDYDRPNPEVLAEEIERSRERISEDIDQLGQRLSPRHLKERAQDALEDIEAGGLHRDGGDYTNGTTSAPLPRSRATFRIFRARSIFPSNPTRPPFPLAPVHSERY